MLQPMSVFIPLDSLVRLTPDASIANGIIRDKIHHLIKLHPFGRNVGVQLVEPIEPSKLEDLLRKEEAYTAVSLILKNSRSNIPAIKNG